MANKQKPDGTGQPAVDGVTDNRPDLGHGQRAFPGAGVNGAIGKDPKDFDTHYGEASYGAGEKGKRADRTVYGGQQGSVSPEAPHESPPVSPPLTDAPAREGAPGGAEHEGHAGTRGLMPGPGADHGPPKAP